MAVSKRTRYEVLKRDNYTCRYCRSTEGQLTVDHVTPVTLGGSDDPSNLVAACRDCNAGKSSTSPHSELVDDVRQDALRHAELTRQAYAVLLERMGERENYLEEWRDAWDRADLPPDWRNSVGRWFEMGVPVDLVVDAARTACTRTTVRADGRFAYMCGIVWSQVRMVDELAEMRRYVEGSFMSDESLTNDRIDSYRLGYELGADNERRLAIRSDPLSIVVDHIAYPKVDDWGVPV